MYIIDLKYFEIFVTCADGIGCNEFVFFKDKINE